MDPNLQLLFILVALPLVFLVFLGFRLIRLAARRARRGMDPAPQRDLLLETLHFQAKASHRNELALEALDTLHRNIMMRLPSGVLVLDPAGNVTYANPSALQLMAREPEDAARMPPELAEMFADWLADRTHREVHLVLTQAEGNRHLRVSLDPLPDDRHLMTLVDKSKEHDLEQRIRYKRDLELMGEMAGGVTHEVKNALAVIQAHVQMLPYGDVTERGAHITTEVNRLLGFIGDFLRSSRYIDLDTRDIDLREWFADLSREWANHELGRHVVWEEPPAGARLFADPNLLSSVLRNLILNGLQACEASGVTEQTWVRVSAQDGEDEVRLVVHDAGPGFPPASRDKLFVPFVTSKEKGSGLGLFHCRKIIMEHGGNLDVTPEPPTRVVCRLPRPTTHR